MQSNSKNIRIMKKGKVSKALLTLGIPIIIGMLINCSYNVIDAYFTSTLGINQVGAISVIFPLIMAISGIGIGIGAGAGSYISRLLGKKDDYKANITASTAVCSSIIAGIVITIFTIAFLDKILLAIGATETILPFAKEYGSIYISFSVLSILNITMNNIMAAQGEGKISMTAMIIGAIANTILAPIFIFELNLGIKGAAIATVIAQGITSSFYVWYAVSKSYLRISIHNISFQKEICIETLKVGVPTILFTLLSSTSVGLINIKASMYGSEQVAAMGIVTRVFAIATHIVFGYSKGLQPIVGYNYGAKNYKRLNEIMKVSLIQATVFCFIATTLMIICSNQIMSIFSNDYLVKNTGNLALKVNGIAFLTFGIQMVFATFFLSLGKGREGGILSICRQGIMFIPVILILPSLIGFNGVIYSQAIADLLTTILTIIFAFDLVKKLKNLQYERMNLNIMSKDYI
ncbi:MATE family efflux transporter [Clostridium saccharobutylicum]|uniref:Multidrug export protein MepA n=1 Tax=Clostridium saccharobutylicum DSM 13864 TaxID=1345695 RepID=U5MUN4_CLOSA|nr:MATE family efflux transporter [Clostridium saccharobutylicum]AGX43152.1 multidrug export protein MepA [Clostridium saccharobutylicum DSM 13864]AQR90449.1 multidrug export protein MepA [Clostridium saccharobutylicum]AQS00355.1 multidrug export protein MepA [Clostridium saccharobutylicum]AQS14338.1 multidrug export protein MepA [Clostridium saccharobutylicum]MBA2906620.1 putative MATE family efflux protein [Clostridium saccharobutylicum]